jgi:charged multivesicular body protein 6
MLAGRMSNQEEDEVEEELDALDRLVNGVKDQEGLLEELPAVPTHSISPKESQKERWERRAREQQEAILA